MGIPIHGDGLLVTARKARHDEARKFARIVEKKALRPAKGNVARAIAVGILRRGAHHGTDFFQASGLRAVVDFCDAGLVTGDFEDRSLAADRDTGAEENANAVLVEELEDRFRSL